MRKTRINFQSDAVRVILLVIGSIFSTLILSFSILAILKLQEYDFAGASTFLPFVFIVLGISRAASIVKQDNKLAIYRALILFVFDVGLGIMMYFGKHNQYLYSLSCGLYCISIIISRIFKLAMDHSPRSIVFNIILIVFATVLGVGLFIPTNTDKVFASIVVVCFIVSFSALIEVLSGAITNIKLKTLFKIIIRTYVLEIFLGLLTIMAAAAIVFMYYEPNVPSFGDGLWYAFAVVTTIGFGDYVATTIVGRIITVVLGIYGIVVVAVITSIIVNFYNETAGKKDNENIKEINKEHKKKK